MVVIDPGINSTEFNRFSPPEDKQRFTALIKVNLKIQSLTSLSSSSGNLGVAFLKELREKFDKEAASSGKPAYLLSAAFGCRKPDIDAGYEIDKISQ